MDFSLEINFLIIFNCNTKWASEWMSEWRLTDSRLSYGKNKFLVKTFHESKVIVNWSELLQNVFQWKIPKWTSRSWFSHSILILNNNMEPFIYEMRKRWFFFISKRSPFSNECPQKLEKKGEKNDYKNAMWL